MKICHIIEEEKKLLGGAFSLTVNWSKMDQEKFEEKVKTTPDSPFFQNKLCGCFFSLLNKVYTIKPTNWKIYLQKNKCYRQSAGKLLRIKIYTLRKYPV